MLITANKHTTIVQYRTVGKTYNQAGLPEGEGPGENTAEHSDFPFDEIRLDVGQSFDTEGTELVNQREITDVPDHGEAAVAP